MLSRIATAVAFTLVCAACVPPVSIKDAGANRHELRADYDFFNPETGIADVLSRRALTLCNGKYSLVKQSVEGTGTNGTLVWIVDCS